MTLNEGSQPLVIFHKEKVKPIQMTKTPTPVVSTSEAQVRSAFLRCLLESYLSEKERGSQ